MLVVGSIVGSGIFLVSPSVARDVGSPGAFMAAWALGGGVALAGALSNGELGGMFPFSGGEYVYLREAYGPGVGFLSGWTSFWIAFPGSIAALAAGFSSTAAGMLGIGSPAVIKGLGLFCIAALTLVNALGLRSGKWLNNALSATKLAAFAVLLALGALVGHGALAAASARPAEGHTWSGIASALVPVLFAYSGWNAATYVAGEMENPARGLGRALGLGTAICVVLYLAVNAAYLRAMTLGELAASSDSPARLTAERLGGAGFGAVLSPLVAVCVLSSLQATILVGPRIYQAMARDGLFFKPLARSHAATGSPGRRSPRAGRDLRRRAREQQLRSAAGVRDVLHRRLLHAGGGRGGRLALAQADAASALSRSWIPSCARALHRGQRLGTVERARGTLRRGRSQRNGHRRHRNPCLRCLPPSRGRRRVRSSQAGQLDV